MEIKDYTVLLLLAFTIISCSSDSDGSATSTEGSATAGSSGAAGTTPSNGGNTSTVGGSVATGGTFAKDSSVDGARTGVSGREAGIARVDASNKVDASGMIDANAAQDTAIVEGDSATPLGDAAVAATCDRACLIGYITDYLDALVASDPSRLKVSATVRYTVNGLDAQLGEGLWQTASAFQADKRLDFADPLEGQVATQTVVDENGISPVLYQVRLKVVQGEITEIEAMEVRRGDAANGFFNVENMKPEPVFLQEIEPSIRMNRDELRTVMELYMDYLEGSKRGSELPFDTNCVRYENGVPTARGISAFEMQSWRFQVTRRYLVFDEEAGIVWGMFPFSQIEMTLVVGEAFKIIEGKFMMIQAVMAYMPSKAWD